MELKPGDYEPERYDLRRRGRERAGIGHSKGSGQILVEARGAIEQECRISHRRLKFRRKLPASPADNRSMPVYVDQSLPVGRQRPSGTPGDDRMKDVEAVLEGALQ